MLTVAERLRQLFEHLGIDRAHVAARTPRDWDELVRVYPKMVSSLMLVAPGGVSPAMVGELGSRLLVVHGDQGPMAERVRTGVGQIAGARLVSLRDYNVIGWTDLVAERRDEIAGAITTFVAQHDPPDGPKLSADVAREGEVAGISYRIRGTGSPLLLLPLFLSPSQWEPVIPALSERYATITLGGRFLDPVALLESRGRAAGYRRMLRTLLDEVGVAAGETILEVGSGSGAVARWLASQTGRRNPIVGIDINRYLLREATILAANDGLGGLVQFREGSAEVIPFGDATFDVAISITVIEEADADRMLAEMVRVTKPGGRVAVIARSLDLPFVMNVALDAALKSTVEAPGAVGAAESHGCADASLYRRLRGAGLNPVMMYPFTATFDASEPDWLRFLDDQLVVRLAADEVRAWRAARAQAEVDGTFFIGFPHHCAIGTKLALTR